jgi:hypothetical protein
VHARDRYAAFADSSGAAFHGAGAHIACGENTGRAGLERPGHARARVPRRRIGNCGSGFDEAFFVAFNLGGSQSVHGLAPIMEKMAGVSTTRRSR